MLTDRSEGAPKLRLAELVHTNRAAILTAWKKRVGTLPPIESPSPITEGAHVVDWLTRSLEAQDGAAHPPTDLPRDHSFSAPRAIAELAFLTETIDHLVGPSLDDAERTSLHRVIEDAIGRSVARDADEGERVRTRLRLATDVTLVGCWELDPSTGIVGSDLRSCELFGIQEGSAVTADDLTDQLHPDDRRRVRDGIANVLMLGSAYIDECRTVRVDEGGPRWIAVAADAHQSVDARVPTVIGIVHDITAAKRAEEEHARVIEELSRAVHISEMFVGILSHDLRNPLGAVLGSAELLEHDARDEKTKRVLALIVSSGRRMGRMIDQLLDFTRARLGEGIPLDRENVDLAILARSAVDEGTAASAASLFRWSTSGDATGPWDRDRLSQILSNLLGNAVQHGRSGGSIDVVVDGTHSERVTLSVSNEGTIPLDLVPVIFNPFRGTMQKRAKSNGLGLGLYVARQIALAHGGELRVETTETDTVFTLTLPRSAHGALVPRHELVREEELAAFESMAAPPPASAVTAQLFGATPLHERAPLEHSKIVEHYATLLQKALDRRTFRREGETLAEDLRAVAERLGDLGAGPREMTDVHARALRRAARGSTAAKMQALLVEGRLLALEVMGNLVSYYRRRSKAQVHGPSSRRGG